MKNVKAEQIHKNMHNKQDDSSNTKHKKYNFLQRICNKLQTVAEILRK